MSMPDSQEPIETGPPSLTILPTVYPTSPPLEEVIGQFWNLGPDFASVEVHIEPPAQPLAILEQLGPSPFERALSCVRPERIWISARRDSSGCRVGGSVDNGPASPKRQAGMKMPFGT